jgi:hypothetical protein
VAVSYEADPIARVKDIRRRDPYASLATRGQDRDLPRSHFAGQGYGGGVRANRWVVAAFAVAVLGAIVASFAPLGQLCTESAEPGLEIAMESCGGVSLLSQEGASILVVVSVPLLVAFAPVLVHRRPATIASAVLLWLVCFAGALSVGLFFVPAAILMTVAAARRPPERQPDLIPPPPPGAIS